MKKILWTLGCMALVVSCADRELDPVTTDSGSDVISARAFYRKIDAEFNLTSYYYYIAAGNTVAWDIASVVFDAGNRTGVYAGESGVVYSGQEQVKDDAAGTYSYRPFTDKYLYFDTDVPSSVTVNINQVQLVSGGLSHQAKFVATVEVFGDNGVKIAEQKEFNAVGGEWKNFQVTVDLSSTEPQSDYKIAVNIDLYSKRYNFAAVTEFHIDPTFDQTGYNIERNVTRWSLFEEAFWGEVTPDPETAVITSDKPLYFWVVTEVDNSGWYLKSLNPSVYDAAQNKYVKEVSVNELLVPNSYEYHTNFQQDIFITDHPISTTTVTFHCEGFVEYVGGHASGGWFIDSFTGVEWGSIGLVSARGSELHPGSGQQIFFYDITHGRENMVLIDILQDPDYELPNFNYYKITDILATTNL